jgi:hypothetical protein
MAALPLVLTGSLLYHLRKRSLSISAGKGLPVVTLSDDGITVGAPVCQYVIRGHGPLLEYVERFLSSSGEFRSLMVTAQDGTFGVVLFIRGGEVKLSVGIDRSRDFAVEPVMVKFFASLRIAPSQDHFVEQGAAGKGVRTLQYPLPADPKLVTAIIREFLAKVYRVRESDALCISCNP